MAEHEPLERLVSRVAAAVAGVREEALTAAGGSTPTWRVLRALKSGDHSTQAELADVVGVRQPTLTHHLDGLERAGLVTRWRDPANRRGQRVLLTPEGERLFVRLRRAAAAFDGLLQAGLDERDLAELRRLLGVLEENV